jgi:DMSO/TMAO reductase YedYZ molybdopterin-dependent catalytic subunit
MAGRRTNLALLLLVPAAVLTGGVTFLVGSGPVVPVVVAHGVVGLALLVLSPWKAAVARRGLRRRRPGRRLSVALTALVLLALVSGLAHSTGTLLDAGPVTAMQVHVAAAVAALVLTGAHVRRRRTRPRSADLSRRSLLRAGVLALAAAGAFAALEGAAAALALPGATRRATGSYEVSSLVPTGMPVTSWLLDVVPPADPATWTVAVASAGVVRHWSVGELRATGDRASVVLDCTGGWWSRQEWSGTRLSRLLPAGATGSVQVVSRTGYRRRLPLTDDLLLAVDVGGAPLSSGHGAPVRLVVPGRRGYHWVKWVDRVEHDQRPWWQQLPLPLR